MQVTSNIKSPESPDNHLHLGVINCHLPIANPIFQPFLPDCRTKEFSSMSVTWDIHSFPKLKSTVARIAIINCYFNSGGTEPKHINFYRKCLKKCLQEFKVKTQQTNCWNPYS